MLKLVIQSPHSSTKALLTFLGLLVKQSSHNLSTRRVQPSTCLLFLASAFYLRHPLGLGSLPSCSVSCCYMLETRLQVLSRPGRLSRMPWPPPWILPRVDPGWPAIALLFRVLLLHVGDKAASFKQPSRLLRTTGPPPLSSPRVDPWWPTAVSS